MSSPIPIILCGRIPSHIEATTAIVQPEFTVVKLCTDAEAAREAVTALMSPSATETPTLDGVEYPRPRVIVMGGGYSHEDFTSIRETVAGATDVPWIRPANVKPGAPTPTGPPPAEEIASRLRKALDDHLGEIRDGKGSGEVWWM